MRSTGFNKISGDVTPMSRVRKLGWHFFNFLENHIPDAVDEKVHVKKMSIPQQKLLAVIAAMPASKILPRALCDIFWQSLPYAEIRQKLGDLKVLDIGCGSAKIFAEFLSKQPEISDTCQYVGVDLDACPDWDELQKDRRIELKQREICDFLLNSELDTNFIISQSALEHIEHDFYVHSLLAKSIRASKKRVIQIHLVPSVACHSIYGIHGYRHYNKRKLSEFAGLYSDFSQTYIFPLGNGLINQTHKEWAMGASRQTLRFTKPKEYAEKFQHTLTEYFKSSAVESDPTFYAFVVDSHVTAGNEISW